MLFSRISLMPLILLAAPLVVAAQDVIPRFTSVDPISGKVGTEILITGEHIGKEHVAELYFTDGTNDVKVSMAEQTATTIKCKIPKGLKIGMRYKLMLLTQGKEPKLIEQPVKVEVVEDGPPTQ